jgi:hypothetical protein
MADGMEGPTPERVAELKAKHGELMQLGSTKGGGWVVVRQPSEVEWDRFLSLAEKDKARALKEALAMCTVESSAPLASIIGKRPAYAGKLANGLLEWAVGGTDLEKNAL